MRQLKVKILANDEVASGFYRMRVKSPHLAGESKAGQFVEVRCADNAEPLLRRPLGVHRISKGGIEMLYEVVGKGTAILAGRQPGEGLDVIGPLGYGFETSAAKSAILVAGGIGVAPLVALAEDLTKTGRKVSVVIGAKTKSHLLCEREFKSFGCTVRVATEDGSKGHKGLVTEILQDMLVDADAPRATICACGPTEMLKAVAKIAADKKMACQVSLEERMACGVGVCLGCPVRVKAGGYKMVCKDGPVFNAEEIEW